MLLWSARGYPQKLRNRLESAVCSSQQCVGLRHRHPNLRNLLDSAKSVLGLVSQACHGHRHCAGKTKYELLLFIFRHKRVPNPPGLDGSGAGNQFPSHRFQTYSNAFFLNRISIIRIDNANGPGCLIRGNTEGE